MQEVLTLCYRKKVHKMILRYCTNPFINSILRTLKLLCSELFYHVIYIPWLLSDASIRMVRILRANILPAVTL